ncbi:hypothetical protein BV25DRAFT_1826555 [Artomyces pyxidatus]|uniref:Uncharacterized protein n=1 Tax=Artomyces pyxidatus TaxID=48021 RepID=A0ACB8SZ97_9AGAM|nr:hypothetical protein BV25DRAFT_1826555 [Artomyces pyxidatus]
MIARDPAVSLEDHFAQGKYPVLFNDDERFPEGESMEDLAARARQAIEEIVLPYVRTAAREGKKGLHVAVVSHGLCISQLVAQLLKKSADPVPKGNLYKGLNNTAWARATVDVKGATEGEPMEVADNDLPPLVVRVTDFNRHSHTDNVKRQKGLGSAAYDPNQKDIRAFFGGQTVTPTEEPYSESNAHDGVVEDAIPKARA